MFQLLSALSTVWMAHFHTFYIYSAMQAGQTIMHLNTWMNTRARIIDSMEYTIYAIQINYKLAWKSEVSLMYSFNGNSTWYALLLKVIQP